MEMSENANDMTFELPEHGTAAAHDYFRATGTTLTLFNFIIHTSLGGDYATEIARRALDGQDLGPNVTPGELARSSPGLRTRFLRLRSQELLEIFLTRHVDNFGKYIIDLLREALRSKPEMLKSKEPVLSLEYVLTFANMAELTNDVIDKRVTALSYEGFAALQAWCERREVPLRIPEGGAPDVVELIATRNVVVHNRGRIDDRYRRTVPSTKLGLGALRELTVDYLFAGKELLFQIAADTDSAVAEKYGLASNPIAGVIDSEDTPP
jgi:hypothetical protein